MAKKKPVTVNGEIIPGYFVYSDGRISSVKYGNERFRKTFISGKSLYPHVQLFSNGKMKSHHVHRLVAEAFVPFIPCKEMGISVKDYERSPKSVKKALMRMSYVHHKDHDKGNPDWKNLTYVSAIGNSLAAQAFYKKK
jgi:hypothetical protein